MKWYFQILFSHHFIFIFRNQKVNHVKNMYENVRWINKFVIWIFCEAMKDNSRALNINSNIDIDIFNSWYNVHRTCGTHIQHSIHQISSLVWYTRIQREKENLFTQINFDTLKSYWKKNSTSTEIPETCSSICNETSYLWKSNVNI